jgi:hypothetical protein
MTAVALPLRGLGSASLSLRLPRLTPGRLAFLLYLGLGGYLALALHAFHGDAYSRVANAYYVLFSRDPHLAAIGFVWTPLPSLFELLFLPAKIVWPGIAQLGLPAVLMSATFMALAVREMDLILRDFGLGRRTRLALVVAFAIHPAIVYYGAIGTSEAPTLFFALLACRNLARYAVTPSTASLVGVGFALAGAFLTRYEAVPAAVGVAAMILLLGLLRLPGTTRERLARAGADLIVALIPFILVFVGWSLASWLIVGSPFTQFTSDYGNSSQMRVWASQGANEIGLALGPSIVLAGLRLGALSIAAPLALVFAIWALAVRRDYRVLAIGAVLGPPLAFMVLAYVLHVLAPWLRYFISIVPLGILLVGIALSTPARVPRAASPTRRRRAAMGRVREQLRELRVGLGAAGRTGAEAAVRMTLTTAILALLFAGRMADRARHAAATGATGWRRASRRVEPVGAMLSSSSARISRAAMTRASEFAAAAAAPLREPVAEGMANVSRTRDRIVTFVASARIRLAPATAWLAAVGASLVTVGATLADRAGRLARQARSVSAATATVVGGVVIGLRPQVAALARRTAGLARTVARAVSSGAKVALAKMPSLLGALRSFVAALAPRAFRLAPAALFALALLSVPVAAAGMLNRSVAVEESKDIAAMLGPAAAAPDRPGAAVRTFAGEQAVAAYLDAMQLPRGAVLMDVFSGFPIALLSNRPEQFVITTDRDFKQALADPPTFGVQYLLAPSVGGQGVLDAVNQAYPDLAIENSYATLYRRFPAIGTSSSWSLYRLTAARNSTSR